jgi:hypothetical protein
MLVGVDPHEAAVETLHPRRADFANGQLRRPRRALRTRIEQKGVVGQKAFQEVPAIHWFSLGGACLSLR